jgi:DNA-binding response OmpR family regulator
VLLVEDDPTTVSALRRLLSSRGYDPTIATSLAEARALVDQSHDVVILDLMLPDGDGAGLLRHVRAAGLPARVVVTTGIDDPHRLADVRRLGPAALLRKPVDLDGLLRAIGGE